MAFPQVQGIPVNTITPLSTTAAQSVTLPTGILFGEKLLLLVAAKNQTVTTNFSWGFGATIFVGATQGTATGSGCFAFIHDCDGTEPSATTVTVNTEASRPVVRAYRISGAQSAEGTGTFPSGTATYDPPALDPAGWGTENTL